MTPNFKAVNIASLADVSCHRSTMEVLLILVALGVACAQTEVLVDSCFYLDYDVVIGNGERLILTCVEPNLYSTHQGIECDNGEEFRVYHGGGSYCIDLYDEDTTIDDRFISEVCDISDGCSTNHDCVANGNVPVIDQDQDCWVVECTNSFFDCDITVILRWYQLEEDDPPVGNEDDDPPVGNEEDDPPVGSTCSSLRAECLDGTCDDIAFDCTTVNGQVSSSCECGDGSNGNADAWIGEWKVDDDCDQDLCCCLVGIVTVEETGSMLTLRSDVQGGDYCTDVLIATVPVPDGDKFEVTLDGNDFRMELVGSRIEVANLDYPDCTGSAERVSISDETVPGESYASRMSTEVFIVASIVVASVLEF